MLNVKYSCVHTVKITFGFISPDRLPYVILTNDALNPSKSNYKKGLEPHVLGCNAVNQCYDSTPL